MMELIKTHLKFIHLTNKLNSNIFLNLLKFKSNLNNILLDSYRSFMGPGLYRKQSWNHVGRNCPETNGQMCQKRKAQRQKRTCARCGRDNTFACYKGQVWIFVFYELVFEFFLLSKFIFVIHQNYMFYRFWLQELKI